MSNWILKKTNNILPTPYWFHNPEKKVGRAARDMNPTSLVNHSIWFSGSKLLEESLENWPMDLMKITFISAAPHEK